MLVQFTPNVFQYVVPYTYLYDSSIKFGGVFTGFEFAQQDSVNQKDKILVVILIFHVSVALVFAGHHLSHVQ